MYKEQVEKLKSEIMEKKGVVAIEDFAVVPFEVILTLQEKGSPTMGKAYRCTLDREKNDQNNVVAKRAQVTTEEQSLTGFRDIVSVGQCTLAWDCPASSRLILTVAFALNSFLFSQLFQLTLHPKEKSIAEFTAEYLHMLQDWVDDHFEGLKTPQDWSKFYFVLVEVLSEKANMELQSRMPQEANKASKSKKSDRITSGKVLIPPRLQDVLQVCRLLYQAIGNLRIGICDGQHRMGAMLGALFNWEITANYPVSDDKPPCTFQRVEAASIPSEDLNGILSCLSEKVMVRVFAPESIEKFEEDSVAYSLARERSQRAHKPRVLVNL
jgi:hypothetical protein